MPFDLTEAHRKAAQRRLEAQARILHIVVCSLAGACAGVALMLIFGGR